jgi:hypothetical protein
LNPKEIPFSAILVTIGFGSLVNFLIYKKKAAKLLAAFSW